MATYQFEQFNATIVNPTIDINPIVRNVNPIAMTIDVDVIMTVTGGTEFAIRLTDVAVVNLTYTAESLTDRVMDHLAQYEV